MTLHPLDPEGGYLVQKEDKNSVVVTLADGLLIYAHLYKWGDAKGNTHALMAYAHREIIGYLKEDGQVICEKRWTANDTLGTIPLYPDERFSFKERFRRSLADSFGQAAQTRLHAVKMLARLRQDAVGWDNAILLINHQHPHGMLRTQIGKQFLSTVLLKSNRGRKPPDLDAFLGPACELYLATPSTPHERSRILHRPDRSAPRLSTGHSRVNAILSLFTLFAEYGIDLSPWENDLIA